MTQVVARLDASLAAQVDHLVEQGVVASRSAAVRAGLEHLVEQHRRQAIGQLIVAGYAAVPQDDDLGWSDEASAAMIAEEPW